MTRADLDEFVDCYRPKDPHNRKATWSEETPEGRWRPYKYEEILGRDKVSLDLFWLRVNPVQLPDDLAAQIDSLSNDRSKFVVDAVKQALRDRSADEVAAEVDRINAAADELNREAFEVLEYQVIR